VHACADSIRHEFGDRVWNSFWRTAVDGRSSSDVAEELKITPAAVRQNKRRVLLRLRQELGDMP
jgi:RNA polymerase sigma-70 factor (ECF subfamily)